MVQAGTLHVWHQEMQEHNPLGRMQQQEEEDAGFRGMRWSCHPAAQSPFLKEHPRLKRFKSELVPHQGLLE